MRVIAKSTLVAFYQKHPDAEEPIKAWHKEAEHAHWKTTSDIKARYRAADFIAGNRVVFNIRGNRYRLVVKIHYNTRIVYVRFVGTHKAYEKIDAESI